MDLYNAAYGGQTEVVRRLLDGGGDVNAQGGELGNALQAAAYSGQKEVVRLLLDRGADVNAQGGKHGNALQAAACSGQKEVGRLLLDRGADVNAQGGEHGNALQAAAYWGQAAVMQLLLDRGAQLLDQDADVNAQDDSGRTALHVAVEAGSLFAVAQLLERGALTNIKDFRGATPLQIATQRNDYRSALLLFPKSTESLGLIQASTWLSLLPGSERHLEIVNGRSMTMRKMKESSIIDRGYPLSFGVVQMAARTDDFMARDNASSRIFILADWTLFSPVSSGVRFRWWRRTQRVAPARGSKAKYRLEADWQWTVQSNTAPSLTALAQMHSIDYFVECGIRTRAITLPKAESSNWPRLSGTSELDIRNFEKTYGILWIMTKVKDTEAEGGILESRTFFSTSEYAQVPPTAAELFIPLVAQLEHAWNHTFRAAEGRLAMKRTELLRANGRNPRLIRDLLGDAQLWDLLRTSSRKQIDELSQFQNTYESEPWAALRRDSTKDARLMGLFIGRVKKLATKYTEELKTLTDTSQGLIELEFNLTSIAEAQKSTSMNKSIKRLSWITLVFLPLMFIASLFGMNIDKLENNPPWYYYIPFAVGTLLMTLAVWLLFKCFDLEDKIERAFNRLARRQAQPDLETGQPRSLSPRRRTAMFSALGKKRS